MNRSSPRPSSASVQELDRGPALEPAVAALGEPDAAHTSLTNRRQEGVRPHGLAGARALCGQRREGSLFEEMFLRQRAVFLKKRLQLGSQGGILCAQGSQPLSTFFVRHVQRFIEIWAQGLPLISIEGGH